MSDLTATTVGELKRGREEEETEGSTPPAQREPTSIFASLIRSYKQLATTTEQQRADIATIEDPAFQAWLEEMPRRLEQLSCDSDLKSLFRSRMLNGHKDPAGISLVLKNLYAEQPVVQREAVSKAVARFYQFRDSLTIRSLTVPYVVTTGLEVLIIANDVNVHARLQVPPQLNTQLVDMIIAENGLPIVYGDSGSGKTHSSIAVATKYKRTKMIGDAPDSDYRGICVYVCATEQVAANLDEFETHHKNGTDDAAKKTRNSAAENLVKAMVQTVIPSEYFNRTPTEEKVVIVLDEMGGYPTFVRALCALHSEKVEVSQLPFRQRLAAWMSIKELRLIVVGTGIEGVQWQPGSLPGTFSTMRPVSVWNDVGVFLPETLRDAINQPSTAAARSAKRLVMNARAAVLFVNEFTLLSPTAQILPNDLRPMISMLVRSAALRFQRLNGLKYLAPHQYAHVMCQAMTAERLGIRQLPHAPWKELCLTYGVLVDRAVASVRNLDNCQRIDSTDSSASDSSPGLFLKNEFHGQRYLVPEAQLAVLLAVLGLGDRDSSGEGFEEVAADFLFLSVFMGAATPGQGLDPATLCEPDVSTYNDPRSLWPLIATFCKGDNVKRNVYLRRIEKKVEPRPVRAGRRTPTPPPSALEQDDATTSLLLLSGLMEYIHSENHEIIINGAMAAYADVIVLLKGPVKHCLLVQLKRYTKTYLQNREAFEELYKLGNREWRAVLATAIAAIEKSERPSSSASAKPPLVTNDNKTDASGTLAAVQEAARRWWTECKPSIANKSSTLPPTMKTFATNLVQHMWAAAFECVKTDEDGEALVNVMMLPRNMCPLAAEFKRLDFTVTPIMIVHCPEAMRPSVIPGVIQVWSPTEGDNNGFIGLYPVPVVERVSGLIGELTTAGATKRNNCLSNNEGGTATALQA